MVASQQAVAVQRNRDGVSLSLIDAWAFLNLLRGINRAARGSLSEANARCAHEMYRAAFSALYTSVGAILDTSDGVHSFPRLCERLRSFWSSDSDMVALVAKAEHDVAGDLTLDKLKAWRNKVIAHRTAKAADLEFYRQNQVDLDEVANALDALASCLNELSVNIDGVVHHGYESSVPGLSDDISMLFARGT